MINSTIEMNLSDPSEIYIFNEFLNSYIEQFNMNSITGNVDSSNLATLTDKITYWTVYAFYMMTTSGSLAEINAEMALINYSNISDALNVVQADNVNNFNSNIDTSKIIIIVLLVFISIVTGILALMIIPIYIMNQK